MEIKKKTLVLSAILMLVLLCDAAMAIPMPPHRFYGNVTIDGKPAPDGTVVSARIGGVEYANTTTLDGKYGVYSIFYVPSNDAETVEKEGGDEGDSVEFYVNNILAGEKPFSIGGSTKLDLKIGEEPEIETEKPVPGPRFLMPMILAIIVALLAIAVMLAVYLSKRKK